MKSKILSLFLFAAILSIAMISAASNFTVTQPSKLSKTVNEVSFVITNTDTSDAENITLIVPAFNALSDGDGHDILLITTSDSEGIISNSKKITIPKDGTETITITYSLSPGDDLDDLALGTFSESIEIVDEMDDEDSDTNETETVSIDFISSFCELGNLEQEIDEGTRDLEIVSIKDKSSDKDWEWRPLDEVEIEVKIKFNSDDRDDSLDAIIQIGLYDTEEKTFIDLNHDEDLEKDISLDEGEKVTETFNIVVPVEDIFDSSSRYKLYIKVYEEDEEDTLCRDYEGSDYFQDIEIKKESYSVVLDQIEITSPVPCGQEVEVKARAYNVGTHDEDRVLVHLFNSELGIDLESNVFSLDEGDSKRISFTFLIPEGAEEKSYSFKLGASFKYSKSSENYREESEDYGLVLQVEGNCEKEEIKNVQITAELDSETPEAIAGKQVIIKSTLKNTGDVETTYTVSISGNSEWSSLNTIDPQTLTIQSGESKNANIYLDIDSDAEGEKEFTIKISYDDNTTEQKVAISITKGVTQDTVISHLRANWFIYVIAIVNIILIIAIIAVVRSMVGRTPIR